MPTSAVRTFSNDFLLPCENDEDAITMPVNLAQGTYPKGTVLGELTASRGTYRDYQSGHADGSQVAKCILKYPVVVDASGNYWQGDTAGASDSGVAGPKYGIAYRSGVFKAADLNGWDATAHSNMGAKFKTGDDSTGIIIIPGE